MENQSHNSEYYQMNFDEQESLLKFTWKDKFLSYDKFKESVSFYAELAEKYKPKYLFVDARKNQLTMSKEIQDWHDNTIIPRYSKAGVKAMAFVVPNNVFSELSHKKAFEQKNAKDKMITTFHNTEQDAIDWLKRQ